MENNMTLNEFLEFISDCSGNEAIDIVVKFQMGDITIEYLSADDFK